MGQINWAILIGPSKLDQSELGQALDWLQSLLVLTFEILSKVREWLKQLPTLSSMNLWRFGHKSSGIQSRKKKKYTEIRNTTYGFVQRLHRYILCGERKE